MNKKKNIKKKFKEKSFYQSVLQCDNIYAVLLFDFLALILLLTPFLISAGIVNSHVQANPEFNPLINELSKYAVNKNISPVEAEGIKTILFNNKEALLSLMILSVSLIIISSLISTALFSISKAFSWGSVKKQKITKNFIISFSKNYFFWSLISFAIIFLAALALQGAFGTIILQVIILFYFYLNFCIFLPLLALESPIKFRKIVKKTFKYKFKIKFYLIPILWFFVVLIILSAILGLLFKLNQILAISMFGLLFLCYLAFQKYYFFMIIKKIKE